MNTIHDTFLDGIQADLEALKPDVWGSDTYRLLVIVENLVSVLQDRADSKLNLDDGK